MKYSVYCLLFTAIFSCFGVYTNASTNEEPERPNIVFILADDMGWNQPSFNGGDPDLTPNIGRQAVDGMRLNEFYTHSVCAPTRAAFPLAGKNGRSSKNFRRRDISLQL